MSESDAKHKRIYARVGEPKCEAIAKNGDQCRYVPCKGSKFCIGHGGRHALEKERKKNLHMYRLAKWQDRMNEFSGHSDVKGLRSEVGILRIVLEERMLMCNDATDLLLQSSAISDLVMKIERVVVSCNKLELTLGQMLDKTTASQFAVEIVEVIHSEVTSLLGLIVNGMSTSDIGTYLSVTMLENISNRILETLERITSVEEVLT